MSDATPTSVEQMCRDLLDAAVYEDSVVRPDSDITGADWPQDVSAGDVTAMANLLSEYLRAERDAAAARPAFVVYYTTKQHAPWFTDDWTRHKDDADHSDAVIVDTVTGRRYWCGEWAPCDVVMACHFAPTLRADGCGHLETPATPEPPVKPG